jgi:hypothetical protein
MDPVKSDTEIVTPDGERVAVEFYIQVNEPEFPSTLASGVVTLSGLHPRIGYAHAPRAESCPTTAVYTLRREIVKALRHVGVGSSELLGRRSD